MIGKGLCISLFIYQNEPVFVCHTKYERKPRKKCWIIGKKYQKSLMISEIAELQFDPFFSGYFVTDMEMNMSMRVVENHQTFSVTIALFFFLCCFSSADDHKHAVLGCYQWNQANVD